MDKNLDLYFNTYPWQRASRPDNSDPWFRHSMTRRSCDIILDYTVEYYCCNATEKWIFLSRKQNLNSEYTAKFITLRKILIMWFKKYFYFILELGVNSYN